MKKSTIFLSLMFAFLFGITMFTTNMFKTKQVAYAKQIGSLNHTAVIIGVGEVEVVPDSFQINFGLRTKDVSLLDGQNKITKMYEDVLNSIKKTDENAYVFVNYSSSYPVSEGGLLSYDFDYNIIVKSGDVSKKDSLIESIINAGATSINNTTYTLSNKEEAYSQALVKAKENADKKINAISKNANLFALKEEGFYNVYESFRSEKIKVCAKVKAYYEIKNEIQNSSKTEEVSQNLTAQNKENLLNNTAKNFTKEDENRRVVIENFSLNNNKNLNEETNKKQEEKIEQNTTENTSKLTNENQENLDKIESKIEEKSNQNLSLKNQEISSKTLEENKEEIN